MVEKKEKLLKHFSFKSFEKQPLAFIRPFLTSFLRFGNTIEAPMLFCYNHTIRSERECRSKKYKEVENMADLEQKTMNDNANPQTTTPLQNYHPKILPQKKPFGKSP